MVLADISYFDLVFAALILFLGLKGLLNGFFKEVFGLIGIIGGILVGSHYGPFVGALVDDNLLHFENDVATAFIGFVVVLAIFWLGMTFLGNVFTKISKKSGLGPMDRLFGFAVGGGKIFFLFAVIIYAMSNIAFVRDSLQSTFDKSILYPYFYAAGNLVVQIDPELVQGNIDKQTQNIQESVQKELIDTVSREFETNKTTINSPIQPQKETYEQ